MYIESHIYQCSKCTTDAQSMVLIISNYDRLALQVTDERYVSTVA